MNIAGKLLRRKFDK